MARPKQFDCDQALKRAMEVFWSRGYGGTSIQNLVSGMGVNRQSVYDTFGDKHALFLKSLDLYCEMQLIRYRELLDENSSAKASFRRLFESEADRILAKRGKGCLIGNSAVEFGGSCRVTAARASLQAKSIEKMFQKRLSSQNRQVISRRFESHRLARFLYSSLQGLLVSTAVTGNRRSAVDVIEITLSALD